MKDSTALKVLPISSYIVETKGDMKMRRLEERKETIVLGAVSQKSSSTSTREQNLYERCENRKNRNIIDELTLTLYTERGRERK